MTRPARQPMRSRPIHPADVQQVGGVVAVASVADRINGGQQFVVGWRAPGGVCSWVSRPMDDEEHADAAARVLAAFVGGSVR